MVPSSTSASSASRDVDQSFERDNPFASIESAQEFVKLLRTAVSDAKHELETSVEKAGLNEPRRLDAFRIALYNLGKLESHMHQSSRILNDLRLLRRLLLSERDISGSHTTTANDQDG